METTHTPNYGKFLIPLLICTTIFGIAGGLFPFLFGAIPGGIAGLAVGLWWHRRMCRRAAGHADPKLIGAGGTLGIVAGLASTLFLHVAVFVGFLCLPGGTLDLGELPIGAFDYLGIALLFGLPIGAGAGAILGSIFGVFFQNEYNRSREIL